MKGFLHEPSLSHLDAIWKAYACTKNEQKRGALGFVCKAYHVDEIRGENEWKDAA